MGASGPVYLTSVANGHVLARSPNGQPSGVVAQNRGDQDQPQQWIIEQGDEPDIIALRCLSNDEYLHADGGTNWSTVGTGEKQWWRCSSENVTAPQACRLSPVDYPNVYLNHFQGIRVSKGQSMKVHMWQWELVWEFCLTWYFCTAGPALPATAQTNALMGATEDTATENDTAIESTEDESQSDAKAARIQELEEILARQAREFEEEKARLKQQIEKQKAEQKRQKEKQKVQQKQTAQTEKPLPKPAKTVTVSATSQVANEMSKGNCTHVVLPPPRKIRREVVGIVYTRKKNEKGNVELPKTWKDGKPPVEKSKAKSGVPKA